MTNTTNDLPTFLPTDARNTIAAMARRALTVHLIRVDANYRVGELTKGVQDKILGIGEAMTVLGLVMTPHAFLMAFHDALRSAGDVPIKGHRAAWIEVVVARTTEALV